MLKRDWQVPLDSSGGPRTEGGGGAADEIDAELEAQRFVTSVRLTRLTILLASGLYAGFGVLDARIVPDVAASIWFIRYGVYCPLAAAIFALTYTRWYRSFAQPLLATLALVAGLGIVGMVLLADEAGGHLYYAGLILVFFCAYTIFQLQFAYAAVACGVPMLAYEGVALFAKSTPGPILLSNTFFLVSANAIGMLVGYLLERSSRNDFLQRRVIEMQRRQADALLRNVLPERVAERLKTEHGTIAEYVPDVTVLFADCVGFTALSERLPPPALVDLLNRVFTAFDRLATRHRLDNIKTIGDAYMVAGGVPDALEGHAEAVAEMALDMLEEVSCLEAKLGFRLQIRIGAHCGPVVAGVIGIKKFVYDLWGDTVNTASRLESHGAPGAIHVSRELRARLGDRYSFEDRGIIQVKGKGALATFFLRGRRSSAGAVPAVTAESSRRAPRFQLTMPVSVIAGGETFSGTLSDISAGGLFVWAEGHVPTDDRVRIRLASPTQDMDSLEVEGRVLHTRSGPDGREGLGIAIDRAESHGPLALRDFLLLFFGATAGHSAGVVRGNDGTEFHYDLAAVPARLTRSAGGE